MKRKIVKIIKFEPGSMGTSDCLLKIDDLRFVTTFSWVGEDEYSKFTVSESLILYVCE